VLFVSSTVPGFATHATAASYGSSDPAVQVWFDGGPMLTILYPTFYEFNVAAKTSSGLWITNVHWDFGDGSTLDIPFSAEREVSDVRYHAYSQPGVYVVSVTAYDNMGNSGSAQVAVNWFDQSSGQNGEQVGTQVLTTYVSSGLPYGSISPSCPNGCPETVGSSISISLNATTSGLVFVSWTIEGASCSGNSFNVCTFTMPDNPVTVSANFSQAA